VRDLAAAKAKRDLALVTLFKEALDIAHLDVVVTIIGTGSEFDFLDLDDLLLGLRFGRLFLLDVFELAVIDQATHRR